MDAGRSPRRSRLRKAGFAALIVSALFAAAEGACRLLVPRDAVERLTGAGTVTAPDVVGIERLLVPHPTRFWSLAPRLDRLRLHQTTAGSDVDFDVSTNSLGLRGPEPREPRPTTRVLMLGDSCTFGLGVDDDATAAAQLQKLFDLERERGGPSVEVVNGGVVGYSSFQGAKLLEELAPQLQPDVVTACFGFNDASVWNGQSDLERTAAPARGAVERALLHSRLVVAIELLLGAGRREPAKPLEGASRESTPTSARPRLTVPEFDAELESMREQCVRRGARFVLVAWPYREQLLEGGAYRGATRQGDVAAVALCTQTPFVNLASAFAKEPAARLFVDRVHATREGNLVAARALFDALRPVVARPPR
jgi:lysophospholipase L1-like esterase